MASKTRILSFGAILYLFLIYLRVSCHEKMLRKIVRNQYKMVQRPFSDNGQASWMNFSQANEHLYNGNKIFFPGFAHKATLLNTMQRPKVSTIFSSFENSRGKSAYTNIKIEKKENFLPNELRLARNTFNNMTTYGQSNGSIFYQQELFKSDNHSDYIVQEPFNQAHSKINYFPYTADHYLQSIEPKSSIENTIVIPEAPDKLTENVSHVTKSIFLNHPGHNPKSISLPDHDSQITSQQEIDDRADFVLEELQTDKASEYSYNLTLNPYICTIIYENKANIDAQQFFLNFDIEPLWMSKKHYWDSIFHSRYESLMRSTKWPPLKVILIPRTHVDTIWKRPFSQNHNDTVKKIISNIVKKLQFYQNLTFTWHEISHLSEWWKSASQKNRSAFRRLVRSGRLEITTGGWVETDEATTHLFGLVHLLIEGHQWLKNHLNYVPNVAWLTNSVTHSPTMPYLLSVCGISNLVITNLHYSWEQYLAEYQYSDFIWVQNWDGDKTAQTPLIDALKLIGNDRYPKHSVLTHYLQFNSANFEACGPNKDICTSNFDFAKVNKNLDINHYNIKEKGELLLEQYSKTGTITPHNVIMAPIGGSYRYEFQTEFDYQYNNYEKIADFINVNSGIYKATVEFGTPKDYFSSITERHKKYQTLKGDFLNFADINSGSPAYWTGFFTSRPLLKILLRRLQSTLRTTEILFSFAISMNAFRGFNSTELFELLLKSRENIARLLDRDVVSGTLSVNALKYAQKLIISTVKDCWYIQEVSASLISTKPDQGAPYLQKYVYRDGDFVSIFKTVSPGDQVYVFNSLSHERTEVVELITRDPNIRILDHNKKDVTVQINPVWKYSSDNKIKISRRFYKIVFIIKVPPMTLELFKIKRTYDGSPNAAAIYCLECSVESVIDQNTMFTFNIQPIEPGDIQLESYKYRLIFDEMSGFLKSVIEKSTNLEKTIVLDYGAFKSADENAGMFLFNTDVRKPFHDIFLPYKTGNKKKLLIISAGQVTTELTCIYGRLLHHTVKIFNLLNSPLSKAIYVESKVDYEVSPKNRELEMFLAIQTGISNGNHPEIYIDNNGFQYTGHILNISRRVESNMYPITSMVYIQDHQTRLSVITDHAQGVTALQEGQLVLMLDRRILFNDKRGTQEGLADNSVTCHRHYLLLEDFIEQNMYASKLTFEQDLKLPSLAVHYLANSHNYVLDIFIIDKKQTDLPYFTFLPLIKTSFPCDVALINYRVVLNKSLGQIHSPNTALMILHRQVASCNIISNVLNCNGDSSFHLSKILRDIKAVYRTNLVGTVDDGPIHLCNKANFPPMEIMTLRVYF